MPKAPAEQEFRSQLTPVLLQLYAGAEHDLPALLAKYGLGPESPALKEVPMRLSTWLSLSAEIHAALGDPRLGLHLAQNLPRGHYGLLEFTVRSCPDLRTALSVVSRYSTLLNSIALYELSDQGSEARWVHRVPGVPRVQGAVGNEFGICLVVRLCRELSTARLDPKRVWFAHPRPEDVSELVAYLHTDDFVFDAGENAFTFERALLDQQMTGADPELLAVMEQQASKLAGARAKPLDLSGRVREQVAAGLSRGDASIDAVARALAMSTRSLQRALLAEGVKFQQLVEQVRESMALEYIRAGKLNLSEVAWALGYSDVTAFLRAFKRWTGTTPGQYRASLPAEP